VLRAHGHQVLHRKVLHRRRRGRAVPVAILAAVLAMPAWIGPPDPASPAAKRATAGASFRAHFLASPFGTIHAPTFRFSLPVGTGAPAGLGLAASMPDSGAAFPPADGAGAGAEESNREFPQFDRSLKGARLSPRVRPDSGAPQAAAQAAAIDGNGSADDGASPSAADAPAGPPHNETVAAKGEVTGAGRRPKSPAELLDLTGSARAKHERCLADAIYFEARGEPVRGQMAVAQVVINRVFSRYYPDNVCGVVYQSSRRHRRVRCQFSFTCDGIPDRITEPDAWDRARRLARDALDGNFWLNDIGKATHYHARWVHPRWVREMRRLDRIGVHTFYRPRRWGDGDGAPVWGDATAKLEKL
jgi:spore germination cell wall hydrolase CwlJ-like protein